MGRSITWSTHFLSLAPVLFLRSILSYLFGEKAEERMLFGSPFVGNYLVKVPCQNKIKEYVKDEADKCISHDIVIEFSTEGGSNLVGLSIDKRVECDDEGRMRDDA